MNFPKTPEGVQKLQSFIGDLVGLRQEAVQVKTVEGQMGEAKVHVKLHGSIAVAAGTDSVEDAIESYVDQPCEADVKVVMPKKINRNSTYGMAKETDFSEAAEQIRQLGLSLSDPTAHMAKDIEETINKSIGDLAKQINESVHKRNLNTKAVKPNPIPRSGDRVEVTAVDGSDTGGFVEGVLDETAIEYRASWLNSEGYNNLVQYWDDRSSFNIDRDETVIEVSLDTTGDYLYAFPESKVKFHPAGLTDISGVGANKAKALRVAGFSSVGELRIAHQSEIAEVEGIGNALAARIKADVGEASFEDDYDGVTAVARICPHCDGTFQEDGPESIEGDDGEWYCSLNCLNEALQ